jgi:hypothetical protein
LMKLIKREREKEHQSTPPQIWPNLWTPIDMSTHTSQIISNFITRTASSGFAVSMSLHSNIGTT